MRKGKNTVIFLDVDGVLTSERCNGYYDFDLWAVHFFKWVCEESGCKIVMSSAWRKRPEAKEWFTEVFGEYLHKDWRTGESYSRGREINEWLMEHPHVDDFVVVDDDLAGMSSVMDNLVLTTIEDGLLTQHMHDIRERLGIRGGLPRLQNINRSDVHFYQEREGRELEYDNWVEELEGRNERKNSLTNII